MKKLATLATLVLQAIVAVLLFMPYNFMEKCFSPVGWGEWKASGRGTPVNFFERASVYPDEKLFDAHLSWLALLVILAGIVVLVLMLCDRFDQITRWGVFAPAVALALMLLVAYLRCDLDSEQMNGGFWSYEAGALIYLVFALQIAATVLAVLLGLNKFKDDAPALPFFNAKPTGPAAELQSLKKLMDAGVITREEFETKKKQLLGL